MLCESVKEKTLGFPAEEKNAARTDNRTRGAIGEHETSIDARRRAMREPYRPRALRFRTAALAAQTPMPDDAL